ncbi:MAG: phosphatidylserine decarboxylase, partial [Thermoleophilaceae bacterium]
MTRRSLRVARRYVAFALLAELVLLAVGRPGGRVVPAPSLGSRLFFRDPERPPAQRADTLHAPADGVVTDVAASVREPWLEAAEATRISTFLSLHNVHVTR